MSDKGIYIDTQETQARTYIVTVTYENDYNYI